jgi:hypothetical protein
MDSCCPKILGVIARCSELQSVAYPLENSHPTRLTMTLGTKMEKYHGVRCHFCGETIPVPARVANKQASLKLDSAANSDQQNFPSLNLRCRVCQKENFYKITDVVEVEDIPDRSKVGKGSSPHRLRSQARILKTATE